MPNDNILQPTPLTQDNISNYNNLRNGYDKPNYVELPKEPVNYVQKDVKEPLVKPSIFDKDFVGKEIIYQAKKPTETSIDKIRKNSEEKQRLSESYFREYDNINGDALLEKLKKDKDVFVQEKLAKDRTFGEVRAITFDKTPKSKTEQSLDLDIKELEQAKARKERFEKWNSIEKALPDVSYEDKYNAYLATYNPQDYKNREEKIAYLNKQIEQSKASIKMLDKDVVDGKLWAKDHYNLHKPTYERAIKDNQLLLEKEIYRFKSEASEHKMQYLTDITTLKETPETKANFESYIRTVSKNRNISKQKGALEQELQQAKVTNNTKLLSEKSEAYNKFIENNKSALTDIEKSYNASGVKDYEAWMASVDKKQKDIINQFAKEKDKLPVYGKFVEEQEKIQADMDKFYKSSIAGKLYYVAGNPVVNLAYNTINSLATLPTTAKNLAGGDYGGLDNFAELLDLHKEQSIAMKTPTRFNQNLITDVGRVDFAGKKYKFYLDKDNNAIDARDEDGWQISKAESDLAIEYFNKLSHEDKNIGIDKDGSLLATKGLNSLLYQTGQMYLFGGTGNLLSKGMAFAKIAKTGSNISEAVGMTAANMMLSHNNYYTQAMQNPDMSKQEAAWFATGATFVEGMLEKVNPMETRMFSGATKLKFSSKFAEALAKGDSKEMAFKSATKYILKDFGANVAKENLEELMQGYAVGGVGEAFNAALGNKKLDVMPSTNELLETIIVTTLSSMPMSYISAKRSNNYSAVHKESILAASNPKNQVKYEKKLSQLLDNGTITEDQYSQAKFTIARAIEAGNEISNSIGDKGRSELIPLKIDLATLEQKSRTLTGTDKEANNLKIEALQNKISTVTEKYKVKSDEAVDGVKTELTSEPTADKPVTEKANDILSNIDNAKVKDINSVIGGLKESQSETTEGSEEYNAIQNQINELEDSLREKDKQSTVTDLESKKLEDKKEQVAKKRRGERVVTTTPTTEATTSEATTETTPAEKSAVENEVEAELEAKRKTDEEKEIAAEHKIIDENHVKFYNDKIERYKEKASKLLEEARVGAETLKPEQLKDLEKRKNLILKSIKKAESLRDVWKIAKEKPKQISYKGKTIEQIRTSEGLGSTAKNREFTSAIAYYADPIKYDKIASKFGGEPSLKEIMSASGGLDMIREAMERRNYDKSIVKPVEEKSVAETRKNSVKLIKDALLEGVAKYTPAEYMKKVIVKANHLILSYADNYTRTKLSEIVSQIKKEYGIDLSKIEGVTDQENLDRLSNGNYFIDVDESNIVATTPEAKKEYTDSLRKPIQSEVDIVVEEIKFTGDWAEASPEEVVTEVENAVVSVKAGMASPKVALQSVKDIKREYTKEVKNNDLMKLLKITKDGIEILSDIDSMGDVSLEALRSSFSELPTKLKIALIDYQIATNGINENGEGSFVSLMDEDSIAIIGERIKVNKEVKIPVEDVKVAVASKKKPKAKSKSLETKISEMQSKIDELVSLIKNKSNIDFPVSIEVINETRTDLGNIAENILSLQKQGVSETDVEMIKAKETFNQKFNENPNFANLDMEYKNNYNHYASGDNNINTSENDDDTFSNDCSNVPF